jgi:hypothetical protein
VADPPRLEILYAGDGMSAPLSRQCVECGQWFAPYYLASSGRCFDCVMGESELNAATLEDEPAPAVVVPPKWPPLPRWQFSWHQREIWISHVVEGEPQTKIAARMGITQATVCATLRRMKRRIERQALYPDASLVRSEEIGAP